MRRIGVAITVVTLLPAAAAVTAAAAASTALSTSRTMPAETREPSAEERSSFDDFFRLRSEALAARGQHPMPPLFAPSFDIQRQRGKPWQVIARVDSAPRHAGVDLCGQYRSSFIYNAKAPAAARWVESADPAQLYVWPAQPHTVCSAAKRTVLMDRAVPPDDAAALLRRQTELLSRARLLLAGNSQCARQRALNFTLSALEPAAPADGAPVMFGMVFQSDRDTIAKVAVRKHRGEYVAWNVSCPG